MTSIKVLAGREVITEQIGALRFHIGLQTFFQTNTTQAGSMLRMVETAVRGQQHNGTEPNLILDVFCGVGFFTLGLAKHARTVIGIDLVEPSIKTARKNAKLNQIDNVLFYSGDARHTIPDILEQHGPPDIIVLDPPRSGAGGKVIRRLARAEPSRIVYVSCNPQTLASDLKELKPFGYEIDRVQPIDLFPHTYHVETIVTLDKREKTPAFSG
jgi:23S rRNA (uracil1939-C5)-methyltransferase